jgi:release factor glutamine methyltransferase
MTIQEILKNAIKKLSDKKIKSARLDAEIILSYVLKKSKEWIYANFEKEISKTNYQKFQKLINQRIKLIPVAYIIEKKEFYGLDFLVNKNVLVPRPETEIMVEKVLEEIKNQKSKVKILEIGTGSGCITISIIKKLTANRKQLTFFYASDISANALKIAKENSKIHKVQNKIKFIKSDLFENIDKNLKFDFVIANLPYLDKKEISTNPELKHEPISALAGGKNGAEIYQKFFSQIKNHLAQNSKIYIEIGDKQAKIIQKIIRKELPKSKIKIIRDLKNLNRVIIVDIQPK